MMCGNYCRIHPQTGILGWTIGFSYYCKIWACKVVLRDSSASIDNVPYLLTLHHKGWVGVGSNLVFKSPPFKNFNQFIWKYFSSSSQSLTAPDWVITLFCPETVIYITDMSGNAVIKYCRVDRGKKTYCSKNIVRHNRGAKLYLFILFFRLKKNIKQNIEIWDAPVFFLLLFLGLNIVILFF